MAAFLKQAETGRGADGLQALADQLDALDAQLAQEEKELERQEVLEAEAAQEQKAQFLENLDALETEHASLQKQLTSYLSDTQELKPRVVKFLKRASMVERADVYLRVLDQAKQVSEEAKSSLETDPLLAARAFSLLMYHYRELDALPCQTHLKEMIGGRARTLLPALRQQLSKIFLAAIKALKWPKTRRTLLADDLPTLAQFKLALAHIVELQVAALPLDQNPTTENSTDSDPEDEKDPEPATGDELC